MSMRMNYELPPPRAAIGADMELWMKGEQVPTRDQIVALYGMEFLMYRDVWSHGGAEPIVSPQRYGELFRQRDEWIERYGFAIPCGDLLDALERHAPIVEIGAGTGYMTRLMRMRGIDVVGCDPALQQHRFEIGAWDPHQMRLSGKTAVRRFRDRTVFCSWPSLKLTWFRQALRAMQVGRVAIIIEEDACADEVTWEYRDAAFEYVEHIPLPAWSLLNDRAAVWIKKREVRRARWWRGGREI